MYYNCEFPTTPHGCRGHMVVGLQLPVQSVPITAKVVSLNLVHKEVHNIM